MAFWIYILRCSDGHYYTGQTDDLEKRVAEHSSGAIPDCYTFSRRPVELVFSRDFPTREEALASERQIKGWSRKKKEAMMRGDWSEVSRLARSPVPSKPANTARAEPVEAVTSPVRAQPTNTVQTQPLTPVRAELVEAQGAGEEEPLRQAQGERG